MLVVSIAQADVESAEKAHIFAAWSNLVTGERPQGLMDCYVLEGDAVIQVVGVWENAEAHNRALHEEANHPAFVVFEAAGVETTHTVHKVVGSLEG